MKCKVCERDLTNYHFFRPRNKFDATFFAAGVPDGNTCFECAGDYRCILCHEIKPPSAFRLQGRVCKDCKSKRRSKNAKILVSTRRKTRETLPPRPI